MESFNGDSAHLAESGVESSVESMANSVRFYRVDSALGLRYDKCVRFHKMRGILKDL